MKGFERQKNGQDEKKIKVNKKFQENECKKDKGE